MATRLTIREASLLIAATYARTGFGIRRNAPSATEAVPSVSAPDRVAAE